VPVKRGRIAAPAGLKLSLGFDRRFGREESNLAMGAVTKWLIHGRTAATERKRGLPSEVVLVAVGVDQFNQAVGIFDAKWTVGADRDLDL
jgi:hypothetical protein